MANPFDEGKQETTRVCHFSGEVIVYNAISVNGFVKLKWFVSCLVSCSRIGEVEYLDVSLRSPDNHQRVGYIEAIAAFRESDGGYRVLAPDIPVLGFQVNCRAYRAIM